jgi:hypothetical protein
MFSVSLFVCGLLRNAFSSSDCSYSTEFKKNLQLMIPLNACVDGYLYFHFYDAFLVTETI